MNADRPTEYQLRAALRAARLIDCDGNGFADTARAYRHAATDGEHDAAVLAAAQILLIRGGLLSTTEGHVHPTPALASLCALDDDEALSALALALGLRTKAPAYLPDDDLQVDYSVDEDERSALGAAGEEFVLNHCRTQLIELQREDLALQTQRVSLISDGLGYDIIAPKIAGEHRRLEVKTQQRDATHTFRFFLSRNEFEVGRSNDSWALVCCTIGATERIVGWCKSSALIPYLPHDRNGRWTEALVLLPVAVLHTGVPEPI